MYDLDNFTLDELHDIIEGAGLNLDSYHPLTMHYLERRAIRDAILDAAGL